jgi:hypothetical protein
MELQYLWKGTAWLAFLKKKKVDAVMPLSRTEDLFSICLCSTPGRYMGVLGIAALIH